MHYAFVTSSLFYDLRADTGSGKLEQTSGNKPNLGKDNTQNSGFDDLANLYNDKNINVTDFEIKIDGKTHRPDLNKTNPNGGAPIYSGLSDKEIKNYFDALAGGLVRLNHRQQIRIYLLQNYLMEQV